MAHALAAEDGIEVIGTVGDRRELLARVRDVELDLVLLDPGFPDGLVTIRELHATRRAVKVVALVVLESEADVIALAEAGVSGFVTYDDSLTDLVNALRSVLDGDLICSPRTAGLLLSRVGVLAAERSDGPAAVGLTAREQDVVELLADGLSNKQIAARLSIELPTVKQHVHHILQKLGVARRGEAVAHLRRRGLLEGARPG